MVHFKIIRSNTYSLFWIICIVSITEVYNQNTTIYGYEGDTVMLSCPLTPPVVSGRTTWRGPPSATVYFYNNDKNPSIDRWERLSVILNIASGAYNLRITNLTIGVDAGMFSCEVNTNPIQQYFINLKLHIQQYINLTGSSEYAFLGKAFTWTCEILKPNEISPNYVFFKRNASTKCVGIGYINGFCRIDSYISKYTYKCLSENVYSLTIPADNMTRDEQNSQWHCESIVNSSYRSSSILLKIAIEVYNVSISPSDNPLTIRESTQMKVRCLVNSNAVPAPNITWYLGSTDITYMAGTDITSINITGNRTDNTKTLECRASNSNKPPQTANTTLNVEYSPSVNTLSKQNIIEGRSLSVICQAIPGNPNSTTFYWTKKDNQGFRHDGATLLLPNIQRTSSGTYRCTAENNYSNGVKGTHSQAVVINVLYPPIIENRPLQIVNESEKVTITRIISSNPLSNVSWYSKTELLITQTSVTTASFTIDRVKCTDTNNYTLVASNGVGNMVTAIVEFIVNCKPISDKTNITLGVTCTTGIEFSTTVIAYPKPHYDLQYENGTRNNQMISTITKNDVNNFTVRIIQDVVEKSSFGVYYLRAINMFGETTVIVNVIEQRRPDDPRKLEVICEETKARVQWISSFNGGDPQYFTVITLNSQDGTILSYRLLDKGENEIHVTYITNLQPSVTYWFSVSAENSHGSSSSNVTSCRTIHVKETASSQTGVVSGSVVGALMLVTTVIIIVIFAHRRYTCILEFEKRNSDIKGDTKKDASNYTTIKEQQDRTQRDMYDELTPNEKTNQYEAIMQKDNRENNEKLYEQLQESVAKEGNSDNRNILLKTKDSSDDKFVAQYAEEYMNTSFMK